MRGSKSTSIYLAREIPQKSYGFSVFFIVLSVYRNGLIIMDCLADTGTRSTIAGSNDLNLKE